MKLSDDLIRDILVDYLNVCEVIRFGVSSNENYRIVDQITNVTFHGDSTKPLSNHFINSLVIRQWFITSFKVCCMSRDSVLSNLKFAGEQFQRKVTSLNVSLTDDTANLAQCIKLCVNLINLQLTGSFDDGQVRDFLEKISKAKVNLQLQHIEIASRYFDDIDLHPFDGRFSILAQLSSIKLTDCIDMADSSMLRLLEHCPNVRYLELINCDLMTDDVVYRMNSVLQIRNELYSGVKPSGGEKFVVCLKQEATPEVVFHNLGNRCVKLVSRCLTLRGVYGFLLYVRDFGMLLVFIFSLVPAAWISRPIQDLFFLWAVSIFLFAIPSGAAIYLTGMLVSAIYTREKDHYVFKMIRGTWIYTVVCVLIKIFAYCFGHVFQACTLLHRTGVLAGRRVVRVKQRYDVYIEYVMIALSCLGLFYGYAYVFKHSKLMKKFHI